MSYKYYLHSRPAAPGAIPDGSIRIDEEDLGGRYGAIYYEKPLAPRLVRQFELLPAATDQPEHDAYLLEAPLDTPPEGNGLLLYTEEDHQTLKNQAGEVIEGNTVLVFDHRLTDEDRSHLSYLKESRCLSRNFGLDRIRLEEVTFAQQMETRLHHVLDATDTSKIPGTYYKFLRENLSKGMEPSKADKEAVCDLITAGIIRPKLVRRLLAKFSPYIGLSEGNRRADSSYVPAIEEAAEQSYAEAQAKKETTAPKPEPAPRKDHPTNETPAPSQGKGDALQLTIESKKKNRPIDDFGRPLIGKKNLYERYESAITLARTADIANLSFSEAFPQPNYPQLLNLTDSWRVAAVRALRESLPKKPRIGVVAWAEAVMANVRIASLVFNKHVALTETTFKELLKGGYFLGDQIAETSRKRAAQLYLLYKGTDHKNSFKDYYFQRIDPRKDYPIHQGIDYSNEFIVCHIAPMWRHCVLNVWTGIIEKAHGKTAEDAAAAFQKAFAEKKAREATAKAAEKETTNKPKRKMPKIYVTSWQKNRLAEKAYTLCYKKGGTRIPLFPYGHFKTGEEARDFLASHEEAVYEAYQRSFIIPDEFIDGAEPRSGAKPHRTHDITPEDLQKEFGLSGAQFGNWVENQRRQEDLNNFYEAMMDLADITGLPPKSLCFGHTLAMQFGSNGMAKAMAHYDPSQIAINLNKKNGAGSLAHEWFHAVDNLFARYRTEGAVTSRYMTQEKDVREVSQGVPEQYITQVPGADFTRQEVVKAFADVYRAIHQETKVEVRSSMLDVGKSKGYWGTPVELAARSFQAYVCYKLAEKGITDDYLSLYRTEKSWKEVTAGAYTEEAYPYPTKAEMPAIAKAYDHLFEVLKTKENENGVTLYSATHHKDIPAMLQESTAIPEESLTKKEREMQDLAAHLGVAMTFIEGPKALHGRYNPMDGSLLVNRKASTTPQWTFAHECFHVMHQEDSLLYEDLLTTVEDTQGISKAQLDAYRQSIGAPDMDDQHAKEELLADAFANVQKEKELTRIIAKKDASLMCRFAAFTKKLLYHAQAFLHRREGSLTKDQFDAFKERVEIHLHSLKDNEGNRIIPKGIYVLDTVDSLTRPDTITTPIKTEAIRLLLIDEKPKDVRRALATASPRGNKDSELDTILVAAQKTAYNR